MKTIIKFSIIVFSLFTLNVYSQYNDFQCEIDGVIRSWPTDGTILKYIPDEYTTIKYVKINFHFMLKADSTLNFRPYDDGLGNTDFTGYDFANALVNTVNQRLSTNEHMHLPQGNSTPVLERNYRLALKGVYFHYDDSAYSCYNQSSGHMVSNEAIYYSINPNSEINVFFLYDDSPNWNGASGGSAGMAGNRRVIMKAIWQIYRDNIEHINSVIWGASWVLLHETGHNLGLVHTMSLSDGTCNEYHDDCLSDTPTIHEILEMGYPYPCPSWHDEGSNYSNNAMDYSGLVAITPQQLGVIHYTLTHDMLSYLDDNYCDTNNNVQNCIITSNDDILWQNNRIMMSNLIIESGGKLTLKNCWLHMPSDAAIIIQQGGQLIIDGASVTNKCGAMWLGIQVWGDSSESQGISNGTYHQGYLEMKNGATIENAVCAVDLWHPNYWSTTGGIIYATDAVFRNNAMAVHIPPYIAYFNSGTERDYNALFDNCTFTIDENYLGTATFYKHVDMNQVKGVKFLGCDFSVEANVTGVSENCLGIGAYGAGFMVDSYCTSNAAPCPDNQINHCTFNGFKKAVSSVSNGTTARSYVIRDAIFTNNNIGVYSQNTGYATIVDNEFSIGRGAECCYGVYADGVTGFCIEENVFEQASGANGETYGIGVFNSQSINDIYLNTFDGLTCGNLAYGINFTTNRSNRPSSIKQGLTYSCNYNTNNNRDFSVLKESRIGGIATKQGSETLPAGNTFSGSIYHFYNEGDTIDYYYKYHGGDQIPNTSKLYKVNSISTSYSNSCLSHYGNSRVIKSAAEKATLANIYQTADNARDRYMAAGDIVRSCINDSVGDLSETRLWLGNINDLASDRMIVASYIQESDFASAMALANTFPAAYNLHDDGLSDHNDYMTLLNLYQTLYNTNRTVYNLTESELNTVKHIADNGSGTSKLMSEAILMELSDRYESQCMCVDILERANRGSENQEELKAEEDDELTVEIAPIPATTWVTVAYTLPHEATKATLSIINSLGTTVMELELNGSQGVKRIDLRDMSNGVYSYIVRYGEHVKTGKLVVAR